MKNNQQGYIYVHEKADKEALRALLETKTTWAYVASLSETQLIASSADLYEVWPEGRAFGTTCEVRWKRTKDKSGYHIEVLTEDPAHVPNGTNWHQNAEDIDGVQARTILLWGELRVELTKKPKIAPSWIEIRIPRPLYYPLEEGKELDIPNDAGKDPRLLRVVIDGLDYSVRGIPVATRWMQLRQQSTSGLKEKKNG